MPAFRVLKRVWKRFRAHGYDALGQELIDNVSFGSTPLAKALRDHLIAEGVLMLKGGFYSLDEEKMEKLGINWTDFQKLQIRPPLRRFLGEFVSGT